MQRELDRRVFCNWLSIFHFPSFIFHFRFIHVIRENRGGGMDEMENGKFFCRCPKETEELLKDTKKG